MLTVTQNASEVIQGILAAEQAPDDAVVRIGSATEEQGLTITVVEEPEAGDQVVEAHGVEIFVEEGIAEVLDDKQLDAGTTGENVSFMISPKGSQNAQPEG